MIDGILKQLQFLPPVKRAYRRRLAHRWKRQMRSSPGRATAEGVRVSGDADNPTFTVGRPTLTVGADPWEDKTDDQGLVYRPPWRDPEIIGTVDEICTYNSEVSLAQWNAKRLLQTPPTVFAHLPDADLEDPEPEPVATAELLLLDQRVFRSYEGGGIRALINVAITSLLRHGAVAIELDVAPTLDDVRDIDLVMPALIDFRIVDGQIIPVYLANQDPFGTRIGGSISEADIRPLNPNQFLYVGIDAVTGEPFGTPPFLPAIDSVFPQTEYRNDLQKVIHNQGWSRLEVVVDYTKVLEAAPTGMNEGELREFTDGVLADIAGGFTDLESDDTWVHYDVASAGLVQGAAGGSFNPEGITRVFDQDLIVAVKSQPAMHGRNWGAALSTTGDIQWQVYALGIETVRALAIMAVEFALTQYLRLRGIGALAKITYPEIRKQDRTAEVGADKVEHDTLKLAQDQGWITGDEAANKLYGHDAVGAPIETTGIDIGQALGIRPPATKRSNNGHVIESEVVEG